MKILFISYHYWPPHFGGELLISIERFESLIQSGHQVVVLTSGTPGLPGKEIKNGIEINRSPMVHNSRFGRGLRRLLYPLWAVYQMWKINFDIMHLGGAGGVDPITSNFANWFVTAVAKIKGAKTVWVHSLADTEEEMFTEEGFNRRLRKFTLDQMDLIVSVSPALEYAVKQYYPKTSHNLPYGVQDNVFHPFSLEKKVSIRDGFSINKDQVVITFLGSVTLRKGFDVLTQVFMELQEQYSQLVLWIIGPTTSRENQNINDDEVAGFVNQLDKKDNVHFWGRIDNRQELASLLAASDIFVFPSRKEGMGIAPMEAMSCGIPVIISKIAGVTDLANIEGQTGLFVEVGNKDSLKSALLKLINNAELRTEMGEAAHTRIKSEFGWNKYIQDWETLYSSLLDKK